MHEVYHCEFGPFQVTLNLQPALWSVFFILHVEVKRPSEQSGFSNDDHVAVVLKESGPANI
jgi:hypothetical protein